MAKKSIQTMTLPLLITRGMIIFPGNQKLIEAGRKFSMNAVMESKNNFDFTFSHPND